jgi:hypothetical protein
MDAHPITLRTIMKNLLLYAIITGLQINLQKSEFMPIAVPRHLHSSIARLIDRQQGTFPMKHLGLPFSIKKSRLAGRQNNYLSLAGRKLLINSIVNALPLHFMQAFLLPQWLLKHIERTKRAFFGKRNGSARGGHCLVNWKKICLPKKHRGLGNTDMQTQNIALSL